MNLINELKECIDLLNQSGINSKKLVHDRLESLINSEELRLRENGRVVKAVSYPNFYKVSRTKDLDYNLPQRKTIGSAGYDFELIEDATIEPKQTKLIPTGVKAWMPNDTVLLLFIRSSLGIKKQLRLSLGTAVIDSDYFENEDNEGEMFFPITNDGELPVTLKKGDRIGQGVFVKYQITASDNAFGTRKGGFGSTGE